MKSTSVIMTAILSLAVSHDVSGDSLIALGDSLTFAYEAEFAFEETILGTTYGDGFGPEVRNWAEILSSPGSRDSDFDLGARDSISIISSIIPFRTVSLYIRQSNNWAIPGLKVDQLRRFVSGEATVLGLLAENPEFASLSTALNFSDFSDADFAVADLEDQIASSDGRLTFFIGGNDINGVYGGIYNGGSPGSFVSEFIDDSAFVLDWVLAINPNIQIVVVNVPHVGITPDVKSGYPTDPVKTARVTSVMEELNSGLATLAAVRGLGYADVYTPTLALLGLEPLCIQGLQFLNTGTTTGDLDYVWLNGPLSANFHPNTNAQALIANVVVDAFNRTYNTGIAPLTATEILGGWLGRSPAEIDLPFAAWMDGYGLTGLPESDDSDLDGIPAGIEFATGLNPTLADAWKHGSSMVEGGSALEISYPLRLSGSSRFTLFPASGASLETLDPFAIAPVPGPDGLARARLPVIGPRGFLVLRSTVAP